VACAVLNVCVRQWKMVDPLTVGSIIWYRWSLASDGSAVLVLSPYIVAQQKSWLLDFLLYHYIMLTWTTKVMLTVCDYVPRHNLWCHSRGVFHLNCWAHRFMLRVTVAFRISHTDDTNAISWGCCVLRNDWWNICPYLGKLGLNPVSGPLSYVCVYGLYQHSELLELYGWAKRFRLSYDIVDIFWLPCMIWLPSWVCRVTVACTQVLLMLLTYCSVALVDCAIVFSM
jgi:hypothetical protein